MAVAEVNPTLGRVARRLPMGLLAGHPTQMPWSAMVGLPPRGTLPKTAEQRAIWSPVLPSNPMGSLEEVALGRLIHRPPILAREVMLCSLGNQTALA
jgi:hypothetical protein